MNPTSPPPQENNIGASQQKDVISIIRDSVADSGQDVEMFLRKLAILLKDPNNRLVQFGNMVLLAQRKSDDVIEFHTFSTEKAPMNLMRNYIGAAKMAKNQGYKKAITYADNPAFVELAKRTGLPVKIGQAPKVQGGVAKPMYTFEVEL